MILLHSCELGIAIEKVLDGAELYLPNPLVYANFAGAADRAHRRWVMTENATRKVFTDPVRLTRLPAGLLVDGADLHLAMAGDVVLEDFVPPDFPDLGRLVDQLRIKSVNPVQVDVPCIQIARFGESIWGHWMLELLAKAVVAERAYPGRFYYAVPAFITEKSVLRTYSTAVIESLSAYGIDYSRLVRLEPGNCYSFQKMHDLSGIWTSCRHPFIVECLRAAILPNSRPPLTTKIAVLRNRRQSRGIFNDNEVRSYLSSKGFSHVDLPSTPFATQVGIFSNATLVVGSLGSDMTSMVFAKRGTGVVTLAPAGWPDAYFTPIFQQLDLRHGDVRGPSTLLESRDIRYSPHIVNTEVIQEALNAISDNADTHRHRPNPVIDGEAVPRRVGEPKLVVTFGRLGNSSTYIRGDWAGPEERHRWSLGRLSALSLPRSSLPDADIWLSVEGIGHVLQPYLNSRPFNVLIDGTCVGSFETIGKTRIWCYIPRNLFDSDLDLDLVLSFEHPICPSPSVLGRVNDNRPLGFGFEIVGIYPSNSYN